MLKRLAEPSGIAGEPLSMVAVLHAGALAYGNVGARERLDFTVIGPAVNAASRIEAIAKALGETCVATGEVARHLEPGWRPLGRQPLVASRAWPNATVCRRPEPSRAVEIVGKSAPGGSS